VAADAEGLLGRAHKAIEAGDWPAARAAFQARARARRAAEALAELGNVLWWMGEADASVRCLERA